MGGHGDPQAIGRTSSPSPEPLPAPGEGDGCVGRLDHTGSTAPPAAASDSHRRVTGCHRAGRQIKNCPTLSVFAISGSAGQCTRHFPGQKHKSRPGSVEMGFSLHFTLEAPQT